MICGLDALPSSTQCRVPHFRSNLMNERIDVIEQCIHASLDEYFDTLGGEAACGVYDMVILKVEKPLLIRVLAYCDGNQTKAAAVLGVNRNTLRKKMQVHGLI